MRQKDFDPIPLKLCTLLDEVKIWYFLDAIASLETGLLVGWLVMLFENSMKYTIIKDMKTSIDQGPLNIVPVLLPAALQPCTNQLT